MGYNTTVFILNDFLDEISKNPEGFVRGIRYGLFGGETVGQTTVMPSDHADVFRLYGTHQNMIVDLSKYSRETLALAERHPDIVKRFIENARHYLDQLEAEING